MSDTQDITARARQWIPAKDEARQLRRAGYDGLWSENGGCACDVDDLYPCGKRGEDCQPGYRQPCPGEDCEVGPCEFHIGREKPEPPR